MLLVADFRRPMLWGTRRRSAPSPPPSALALAGWRVVEAGGRVGLMTIEAGEPLHLRPATRDRAMAAISGALARAHERAMISALAGDAGEPPLDVAFEKAISLAGRGATIFLATGLDNPGPNLDALLLAARRRNQIVVLLVRDAFERTAPRGAYPFLSADTGGDLRWAFVTGDTERGARADRRIADLERIGIEVRPIDAGDEWTGIAEAMEGFDAGRS